MENPLPSWTRAEENENEGKEETENRGKDSKPTVGIIDVNERIFFFILVLLFERVCNRLKDGKKKEEEVMVQNMRKERTIHTSRSAKGYFWC